MITGCAGFIGYHLAQSLQDDGHKVSGFDNFNHYYDVSLKNARANNLRERSIEVSYVDLKDLTGLTEFMKRHKPDIVMHLAAYAGVRHSLEEPQTYIDNNVTGTQKVNLESTAGMVSSWMMIFQRSDINLRNEWSNYTNWPYNYLPHEVIPAPMDGDFYASILPDYPSGIGPGTNPKDDGTTSGLYITGDFHVENHKNILVSMAIVLDGTYRENLLDAGVYNYIEKYVRTSGGFKDGLYLYNFGLNTDPFDLQPSGAMNLSKFKDIQLEFTTYVPPLDPNAAYYTICDPSNNQLIGVNKQTWQLYDYNYNLSVLEERYNVITFVGGNCSLMYAR